MARGVVHLKHMTIAAQKTVYVPDEWRQNRTDTLLYKESDSDKNTRKRRLRKEPPLKCGMS